MDLGVKSITKTMLAKYLEGELKCSRRNALRILNNLFGHIQKNLELGYRVQLTPFGIFVVRHRAEHRCKNPKTGETYMVKAKKTVCFKPGKALKNLKTKS